MRSVVLCVLMMIAATIVAEAPTSGQVAGAGGPECGPSGSAYMRTTLYFGTNKKSGGSVSNREWSNFLRDDVTTRFPQGFTVWEANGQWRLADGRIQRERSKVLLVVHDDETTVRARIAEIIGNYKESFEQESVLWETSRVCAAF